MADRFYITGLPRSGTAWLSRLFCHGDVACLHDPFGKYGAIEAVDRVLDGIGGSANGISDSGLPLIWRRQPLRDGRWLIVRRGFEAAADSFMSMPRYPFEGDPWARDLEVLREIDAGLKEIEGRETCRVVSFDDLGNEDVMRSAWDFLLKGREPWSDWHWRELRSMRIVTRPEVYEWRS